MLSLTGLMLAMTLSLEPATSAPPVALVGGCHRTTRSQGGLHRHDRNCRRIAVKRRAKPGTAGAASIPWGPGVHCHRDQRDDHASGKHAHSWASCKPTKSGEQSVFTTH